MTSSLSSLTARTGNWAASHRRLAILGWLGFVIAAVVLGSVVGFHEGDDADAGTGSSARADRIVDRAFPEDPSESVLVRGDRAAVPDVAARLRRARGVRSVAVTARRGDNTLLTVHYAHDVNPVLAATKAAARAHPQVYVGEFGEDSLDVATSDQIGSDMAKAEAVSVPITLVLLLLSFGSIVAALVPLGLALTAVFSANGLVALLSHAVPMPDSVNSVVLLVGLAVGVDYSLFYLRREREERAAGRGAEAALNAAAATSGHAVLVSGLTVMIAMAGMFLAGSSIFSALAYGSMIVVAVALLASLTVLPALMATLSRRLGKVRRRRESRVWPFVLDRVLRRPVVSVIVAGGLLVALAVPALGMHTSLPSMKTVPKDLPVRVAYDRIEDAFPGDGLPATVVLRGEAGPVRDAIAGLHPTAQRVTRDGTVAAVDVPLPGDGDGPRAVAALRRLRAHVATLPGVRADVTGWTAGDTDFAHLMRSRAPIVFAFVLGLAFLLLLVTFRSVVIPLKAIVLNLLSVGAAYGVLTLAFDQAIVAWLPMFLFVILFGLSMDYHVFIVSRIRELRFDAARSRSTTDAVSGGIRATASVVTSAAAIMVAVFGAFGLVDSIDMRQMGVGLGAAVLIDATLIRAVLLPATMTLLGEANWWWPGRRAPRIAPLGVRSAA